VGRERHASLSPNVARTVLSPLAAQLQQYAGIEAPIRAYCRWRSGLAFEFLDAAALALHQEIPIHYFVVFAMLELRGLRERIGGGSETIRLGFTSWLL